MSEYHGRSPEKFPSRWYTHARIFATFGEMSAFLDGLSQAPS
jgi:hypothetical protein